MFSVPLKVNRLKLSNKGKSDSLNASWEKPSGDLDFYNLVLLRVGCTVDNISVSANTTSTLLPFLRPGALYKLLVTTVSGTQTSKLAEAECRTGNFSPVEILLLCCYAGLHVFISICMFFEAYTALYRDSNAFRKIY